MPPPLVSFAHLAAIDFDDDGEPQYLHLTGEHDEDTLDEVEGFHLPPGYAAVPAEGCDVILVYPDGDPDHPVALAVVDREHRLAGAGLFTADGWYLERKDDGTVALADGTDALALAKKVEAELKALKQAITNAVPSTTGPPDSGAALQTSLVGLLTNWPADTGAAKVTGR